MYTLFIHLGVGEYLGDPYLKGGLQILISSPTHPQTQGQGCEEEIFVWAWHVAWHGLGGTKSPPVPNWVMNFKGTLHLVFTQGGPFKSALDPRSLALILGGNPYTQTT